MAPLDQLPDPLPIEPLARPFDVTIRPPGSKSITNRALLLAALADGTSTLRAPLIDADDAQVMIRALEQLGAKIEITRAPSAGAGLDEVRVTGVAGRWKIPPGQTVHLDLHNAGTATRFLTAAAMLAPPDSGGIVIDGDARMRERPIQELADALAQLGIETEWQSTPGFPPLRVVPTRLMRASPAVTFGRTASSQFISAMILAAPFLPRGMTIRIDGEPTSPAYIRMTEQLVQRVGVALDFNACGPSVGSQRAHCFHVPRTKLPAFVLEIEPDLSGATFLWSAAYLIRNARMKIAGLGDSVTSSLQGDADFLEFLHYFSGEHSFLSSLVVGPSEIEPWQHADLSNMPDTAMAAAVLACFAAPTDGNPTATSTLRGLRTLRVKETDRLAALQTELSKIGARVEIFKDGDDEGLRITPPPSRPATQSPPPVFFDTYNDHRMAMALALVGLRRPNVFIRNPACVRKTYPGYWADFAKLYQ